MMCWTRSERMPDTDRTISDDEDEELQELMRQGTDDGLMTDVYSVADQSCKPETAGSLTKTPHTLKSHTQVLLTFPQVMYSAIINCIV